MSELAQKISAHFKEQHEIAEGIITMLAENQQLQAEMAQLKASHANTVKSQADAILALQTEKAELSNTIKTLNERIAVLEKPDPVTPVPEIQNRKLT